MRVPVAATAQAFPKWEEYPHTPAVFVRVANKGVVGYGTWKNIRKMEVTRYVEKRHPPPPGILCKECAIA